MKLQNSLGLETEIITPGEVREICEYIDVSDLVGASYNPNDGKAHPFDVVAGFKDFFDNSPVEFRQNCEVVDIDILDDGRKQVVTAGGNQYEAPIVVNSAGGWSPRIGDMVGVDIPLEPYRHQAIITEPIRKGTINPMVISLQHEDAYLTQTERGGIVGGVGTPESEGPTYDTTETLEFERRISRAFTSIIPRFKYLRILRHWGGYYAMTPDGNPLIGEYKVPGFYLATGFSGHGYMMAPSAGEGIADMILGKASELPLDYYDPERIERGELREGALQMG